ncbi:MAG: hypothetical protein ABJN69_08070 [Hellea sp.]
MTEKIQAKWKEGFVLGHNCIARADGSVTLASTCRLYDPNTKTYSQTWGPLCDTTVEGLEKYDEDLWTEVDIFHSPFMFENQVIVYGDGGMGNEGYVASTNPDFSLNWSLFFTFSNPITKAEVIDRQLICYGSGTAIVKINMDDLTSISVTL